MRASRNEKDASARIQELEDVSALKVPEARVESLRRALDEAEDKAGVRLRQATETLTIAASALLGLVWVSIVALFGLKLKTAYDIETFWVAVPLVCVAVAVWFALVFVDVFGPAWLDASAARGVAPEDDSDARRAWRAEAPTPARLVEAIAFAELPYWAPWFDGPTERPGSWRRDVAALRRRAAQEDASELGPETRNYRSLGERVLMLPTGESVRDVLRRCFLGGLLGPDAELLLHLEGARAGLFASRETRTLVAFFRGTKDGVDAMDDLAAIRLGPAPGGAGAGAVGRGFAARATRDGALARIVAAARNFVEAHGEADVYAIGHSLGAAVASVVAAALAAELPAARVTLATFGSPRVGDLAFARHCASLANLRVWRVQNELDPVTRLAWWFPRPARYRHLAGHYVLLERGLGWCFPPGALAPFVAAKTTGLINWPGIVIQLVGRWRVDGRFHMTGHRHGYTAALRRCVGWCDETDWSWNGFDYWCNICALCVVSNAVIFLLVVGVHAYSGRGWDEPCVRGRRTQHVVDIFGTIQCLCLAFMLVSLGMAKLVSRDHVVRAGLTTGRVLAPAPTPAPNTASPRLAEGAAASEESDEAASCLLS